MTDHDSLKSRQETVITKLAKDAKIDLSDVLQYAEDPRITSLLLVKLSKEREQTNQLLSDVNRKFDEIMFALKTTQSKQEPVASLNSFEVLPEADQKILSLVRVKGQVDANLVKECLSYKGLNAASQRLNALFKQGVLKKVQSGRKVLYLEKV
ncbi:MAG: hypothetical protein ABH821_01940 [archaeon]